MKNTIKRIVTIIMAIAILFTAVNPTATEAAAKKATLNKKTVTLTITNKKANPSATVKVKNAKKTVKWTTSKKKVAAIQKTGKNSIKITAKKAGKATVTCKVDGRKLTCKVTVVDKRTVNSNNGTENSENNNASENISEDTENSETIGKNGGKPIGAIICATISSCDGVKCRNKIEFFADAADGITEDEALEVQMSHFMLHLAIGDKKKNLAYEVIYY